LRIIDLSNGVTPTGLLAASGLLFGDFCERLETSLRESLAGQGEYDTIIDEMIGICTNAGREVDPGAQNPAARINARESASRCGAYSERMGRLVTTRLEFAAYLSLVIILENAKGVPGIRATVPGIGTGSSLKTLRMFEREKCKLDPSGVRMAPLFGRLVLDYFRPFADAVTGVLRKVEEKRDPLDRSLAIRVFEVEEPGSAPEGESHDTIAVLEANIDDMTSEILSASMKRILKEGALDYTITPVMMKKGRTGFNVQILCTPADADLIARELLRTTSTFGVRKYPAERMKLARKIRKYGTKYGTISVKEGFLDGELVKVTPELDDILELSDLHRIPAYTLYNDIIGELNKDVSR
jgi:hypothetical protein